MAAPFLRKTPVKPLRALSVSEPRQQISQTLYHGEFELWRKSGELCDIELSAEIGDDSGDIVNTAGCARIAYEIKHRQFGR